jgi:hypothetical protein
VSKTGNGGAHVKINDGSENLGVLYLDQRQLHSLIGILTTGTFAKEVEFIIKNPFEDGEEEDIVFDYN